MLIVQLLKDFMD
jgi:hypothetical protein